MGLEKLVEVSEIAKTEKDNFKEIKPQNGMTLEKAKDFVKSFFEDMKSLAESGEFKELLKELKEEYIDDLKSLSEFAQTFPEKFFDIEDLKKVSPEENKKLREEFIESKDRLKKQWEDVHGIPWPKYDKDVYITNKDGEQVCIRKAEMDYDAHHIQPLGLGGKNEVSNITPMHADVHFDSRGIHKIGSAYYKIDQLLGGE
ncbi:HNH endonuclease signature motif containing protein [Eshraghiella crossota]